ncbi:MAG TPA: N-acetylglucosamine-specific PTS transporter subunit IIBC [Steroidobacteraceae bacterium]|jgi:PTS system N-acetylglucosamine-specific IIC component|nr:N-acetylglucosamine-specific PTS transporter subunit IIBC [Steroidobacteraceae bacterium]
MKKLISKLQPMGRALMLPIAVLPVAALLLRLGQADLLDVPAIAAAGDAIFQNLGLLFAIGVAVGLAQENHGAAGLAAVVGYLVAANGARVLIDVPPEITGNIPDTLQGFKDLRVLADAAFRAKELAKLSVPIGLLSGLIAGWAYNRYSDIRLPSYLAFFGGRRFVPIISGFAGVILALAFGFGWQTLEHGMDVASQAVLRSGEVGLFVYGVLNRVLIVTGLHHIINNMAWFLLGDFKDITGDLRRFAAGDPSAGAFMSGFFPVMMFGLPGACLAMYRTATPAKRAAVGGILFSMALTSFLTGVTEPIEFAFMFLAPVLYAIHAVLTGIAMVLMDVFGVHLGFGFSAGLFDYVLNFSKATRPLLLVPIGLSYFALYYVLFRFVILRFDLKTLGRETDEASVAADAGKDSTSASGWILALGGSANLKVVEACTTRLRLVLNDVSRINEPALKALGSRGVLRLGDGALQVVVGPIADQLASEIRMRMRSQAALPSHGSEFEAVVKALGGKANIRALHGNASRLFLEVRDPSAIDENALRQSVRAVARPAPHSVHLVVGPAAGAWIAQIKTMIP